MIREPSACPCPCGEDHSAHPGFARVASLIREHGPTLLVCIGARSWSVPRAYIAFHGLRAKDVGPLADRYGWSEVIKPSYSRALR